MSTSTLTHTQTPMNMQSLMGCCSSNTILQLKPNLNEVYAIKTSYYSNSSSLQHVDGGKTGSRKIDEKYMEATLQKELIPKHVAIILDGSRRWCKAQGKPLNYDLFFQSNTLFADLCLKWGVGTATTFVYSYKNLQRAQEANDLFFGQLERYLEKNLENFTRKEIKVSMIGERLLLPKSLQDVIKQVEQATSTKHTKKLELMIAICYCGTRDIMQATRSICEKVKAGVIEPEAIDEALFDKELWTRGAPHPDLLIRTGGRFHVSDYLMWQSAQTEHYFSQVCVPEFGEVEFLQALRSFQHRERTFGK